MSGLLGQRFQRMSMIKKALIVGAVMAASFAIVHVLFALFVWKDDLELAWFGIEVPFIFSIVFVFVLIAEGLPKILRRKPAGLRG